MERRIMLAFVNELEKLSCTVEEQIRELQGVQYRLTQLQREIYNWEEEPEDD